MALRVHPDPDIFMQASSFCRQKLDTEGDRLDEQNKKVLTVFIEWSEAMIAFRDFPLRLEAETSEEEMAVREKSKRDKCDAMFRKFRELVPLASKVFISQWPSGDWRRKFWFGIFQQVQSMVTTTSTSSCGMRLPYSSIAQKLSCVRSVFSHLSQCFAIFQEKIAEAKAEEEKAQIENSTGESSSGASSSSETPSIPEMLERFIATGKLVADGVVVATDVVKKAKLLKETCAIL